MPEKTDFERIAQAVQGALDITGENMTHVMVQLMQTGYTIGLADAKKAS